MMVQLSALYTDPECYKTQRHRQKNRQTNRQTAVSWQLPIILWAIQSAKNTAAFFQKQNVIAGQIIRTRKKV